MDQLAAAIAELSRFQKEQEERHEQRRTEQQRQQEERMKQQQEEHQEQVRNMQEQHEQQIERMLVSVRDRRPTTDTHLKIAPFQANENIQDFLEAFEGIMRIQHVDKAEWVLCLTPLLSGKAQAVCTTVGLTADYEEVKRAILEHYSINPDHCMKRFRAHRWTKDSEPNERIAQGLKLLSRWLKPDEGVEKVIHRIAVEHFQDALPQELCIWVTSHNPATPSQVAKLIESYDSAHNHPLKRRKNHYKEHEGTRETSNKGLFQGKQPGDRHLWNITKEKKPLSEVVCYKCDKKGHYAWNCTEKTFHVREDTAWKD